MEIWKDIKGYEGTYQVSNQGRVRSLDRMVKASKIGSTRLQKGKLKVPSDNGKGYMFLWLYKSGKNTRYYMHRLVASAFINNLKNKKTVNHIDGNKSNNYVENLEWSTYKENNDHAVKNGLANNKGGPKVVIQVDLENNELAEYKSASEASRKTGIARSSIQGCCKPFREGQKTAGGYKWKFK